MFMKKMMKVLWKKGFLSFLRKYSRKIILQKPSENTLLQFKSSRRETWRVILVSVS